MTIDDLVLIHQVVAVVSYANGGGLGLFSCEYYTNGITYADKTWGTAGLKGTCRGTAN